MSVIIRHADLASSDFSDLVNTHVMFCDSTAPAESCHRLPLAALSDPSVTVWSAHEGDGPALGMGGLKELTPTSGEVKSMHTRAAARGKGIGRMMLETIIAEAVARGYDSLWLETGVHDSFAAAHALYRARDFIDADPFGDYVLDPNSLFMTYTLAKEEAV